MTPEQRERIAMAIRALSVSEVARRMGLSTEAVLRLAVGAGSQEGTEVLAVQRLDRLDGATGS